MAYADATHTRRNLGTAAAVTVIEAGLAMAIIAGLSYSYSDRRDQSIKTTFTPNPPEVKKPVEPPKPKVDPVEPRTATLPLRDPVIDLGPAPTPSFAAGDTGLGDKGVGEVVIPLPLPSPSPSFAPIKAKPRGNPGNWVTENDYPTSEIRLEHEGITRFRLSIDAAGKVTSCTVTQSSGWPVLDATACDKLQRRARFDPSVDSTGARVEGSYSSAVNWRLPKD